MFQVLINWLADGQNWLSWIIRECWRQIGSALKSYWAWIIICVGWIYTGAKFVGDCLTELVSVVANINIPTISNPVPSGAYQALAFINTILPLTELVGFVVALILLRLGLTMYRLVKSWIPTLS